MAKIETDLSVFTNPSVFSHVKEEKKTKRGGKTEFSTIFDDVRSKNQAELGPLLDYPVSEDTVNKLMDEVRSAGDILRSRPLPEEILHYKQAVRNFINYVTKNTYDVKPEDGIPKYQRPNYNGKKWSPDAMDHNQYFKIQVIDKKLDDLAAIVLSGQGYQLNMLSRLEEIQGLLVDLLK
jgi:uncharacterized protein YaaR (DUF327 family)